MSQFCHVSMLIDLDHEPWPAGPRAYTDTAVYLPRRSRVLVHESIHYWQQLSQGYLLALAEEDWNLMLEWERSGGRPARGPVRTHYYTPEGRYGFSAYDLCECFARFWEVLLGGPAAVLRDAIEQRRRNGTLSAAVERDWKDTASAAPGDGAFDMAMDLSGSYGIPYCVARRVLDRVSGLVIFPYLAHFALQTPRPAYFFERFVAEVAPAAAGRADELGLTADPPRPAAPQLYPFVEERCAALIRADGGAGLMYAREMFRASPLLQNRVYLWSFQRLQKTEEDPFDLSVCLPGLYRDVLAMRFAPPCVRFRDGQTLGAGQAECLEIHQRWQHFQHAMSSAAGQPPA
jgi:hypothetical protein